MFSQGQVIFDDRLSKQTYRLLKLYLYKLLQNSYQQLIIRLENSIVDF
jgi:hypothetical protein